MCIYNIFITTYIVSQNHVKEPPFPKARKCKLASFLKLCSTLPDLTLNWCAWGTPLPVVADPRTWMPRWGEGTARENFIALHC